MHDPCTTPRSIDEFILAFMPAVSKRVFDRHSPGEDGRVTTDQLGQMLREFEWCDTREADKLKKISKSIELGDTMSYPEFLHVRPRCRAEPFWISIQCSWARLLPCLSRVTTAHP